MVTDMDTTDHTDTGVTMVRDLLMMLPPPLDLTQMLKLILITDMATDMDTTDHTDTGDTMVRDLLRRLPLLDPMLMLMLMLGMDTMDADGVDTMDTLTMDMDMDIGERSKSISTLSENTITFFLKKCTRFW